MVKVIESSAFAKRGIDVMDFSQLHRAKPEEYMIVHTLGSMSRAWRRRMYFQMLKQALWARNDALALYAFEKCILFVMRRQETSTEPDYWYAWGVGKPSTLWSGEKEAAQEKLRHRLVRFCRAMLNSPGLYQKVESERGIGGLSSVAVALPETWKRVAREVLDTLRYASKSSLWNLPKDEKLIGEAYNLIWDAYCGTPARKALNLSSYVPTSTLPNDLLEMLKQCVILMDFQQVVYFLERYPNMHRDFLMIFRYQFIREGGAIDLKGPPLKK